MFLMLPVFEQAMQDSDILICDSVEHCSKEISEFFLLGAALSKLDVKG